MKDELVLFKLKKSLVSNLCHDLEFTYSRAGSVKKKGGKNPPKIEVFWCKSVMLFLRDDLSVKSSSQLWSPMIPSRDGAFTLKQTQSHAQEN